MTPRSAPEALWKRRTCVEEAAEGPGHGEAHHEAVPERGAVRAVVHTGPATHALLDAARVPVSTLRDHAHERHRARRERALEAAVERVDERALALGHDFGENGRVAPAAAPGDEESEEEENGRVEGGVRIEGVPRQAVHEEERQREA